MHLRRIVENLFGIVANRWRVFRSIILLPPNTIEKLVLAALTLHNYLRQSDSRNIYCPLGFADSVVMDGSMVDGSVHRYSPSESLLPLQIGSKGYNPTFVAIEVRDAFKEYFYNEGLSSGNGIKSSDVSFKDNSFAKLVIMLKVKCL